MKKVFVVDIYIKDYWARLKAKDHWELMTLTWNIFFNDFYVIKKSTGTYVHYTCVEFRDGIPEEVSKHLKELVIKDIIE